MPNSDKGRIGVSAAARKLGVTRGRGYQIVKELGIELIPVPGFTNLHYISAEDFMRMKKRNKQKGWTAGKPRKKLKPGSRRKAKR